jgi:hypothetical protein
MKACGARAAVIKGSKGAEGKWATRYRVWKHGTSILTQHLSDILDACQTDDQCTQRASYVEAWRNYWNAINEIFHDEDPRISQVVEQMHDAQDSLQRMTQAPREHCPGDQRDHHRREDWYGTSIDRWITTQHSSY